MDAERPQKVVVAGASGFIGRALPEVLSRDYELIGLSRDPEAAAAQAPGYSHWRQCDLFSRLETRDALAGADLAIYLVHSMLPSARLTQGSFRDMDLICADNFARAARAQGIERILYVGELLPLDPDASESSKGSSQELPEHLQSRLEVEQTLAAYGARVLALRPGVVIGPGSLLTEGFRRLIARLPLMLLPAWTTSRIAPLARQDLVRLLAYALKHPELEGSFDLGGPDAITYAEMLAISAALLGKPRKMIQTSLTLPAISTAWVSFFTGRPRQMIRPLVDALSRDFLPPRNDLPRQANLALTPVRKTLTEALSPPPVSGMPSRPSARSLKRLPAAREVRSVQRLPLPEGRDAQWIAREYARWLPLAMRPLIAVNWTPDQILHFRVRPIPWPILELKLDTDVSHPDRHLFWISGGLLVSPHRPGRLEFRTVLNQQFCLAGIHRFRPRLPWQLYRITQALFHALVMAAYARHLRSLT